MVVHQHPTWHPRTLRLLTAGLSGTTPESQGPSKPSTSPPKDVAPLDSAVLNDRPEVKRARRRAERLARPAYVNTDATCRKGLAGLAYDSWALGQRIEVVACRDIVKAEHLALLMAMEDADRALSGPVAFRVDSTAVANIAIGTKPRLDEVRTRIKLLLKRHPDWSLVLIERRRNKVANNLACRPFLEESGHSTHCFELRGRHLVVLSPDLVNELRPYVYAVVGMAASEVGRVADDHTCRHDPELLGHPLGRHRAACALLDVFGWRDYGVSSGAKINLHKHGWALNAAVDVALEVANDTLAGLEVTPGIEGDAKPPVFQATRERVAVFSELSLAVSCHRLRMSRHKI